MEIKSRSKKELRNAYGVSQKTFNKWLKRAGIKTGSDHILTPAQVEAIYTRLGMP